MSKVEKKKEPVYRKYSRRFAKDFCDRKIFWQKCSHVFTHIVFSTFYTLKVYGRENIPQNERFIASPNHISYFDPFLTSYALWKPLAYMAKKELFEENWLYSFILDELAAFAVNRENLEISTMKTVKEIFKTKNWNLGIFPQGGIRTNKKIEKITKGFAVIAKSAKCNILPISIVGCEEYNKNPLKRIPVTVKIGKLISYDQDISDIIAQWSQQIAELSGYELISEEAPIPVQV